MTEFAVVRGTSYCPVFAEEAPRYVMRIERRTDASLIGMILDDAGAEVDSYGVYETRPSYSRAGWSRSRGELKRPGRVDIARLIADGFETIEAAKDALAAAGAAWAEARDFGPYEQAGEMRRTAVVAYDAEKKRLEEEMRQRLAALNEQMRDAQAAENRARIDAYERMGAAAKAAAKARLEKVSA